MILQEIPPILLHGVPVVPVPPTRPFQSSGHGCCLTAKLRLSVCRTGVHMMASHANTFEWDEWRRHTACSLTQELAAKLVGPAEGKCQRIGNAQGRGGATTDLSQAFPEARQIHIFATHQVALAGTP